MGRVVSPDDSSLNVLASGRLLTGNIITLDHTRSNASDGNFGYYDNEIDMADLESLRDTKVGNVMRQVRRPVFPDSFETFGLPSGRFFNCVPKNIQLLTEFTQRKGTSGRL